jgi:hypothetical protein
MAGGSEWTLDQRNAQKDAVKSATPKASEQGKKATCVVQGGDDGVAAKGLDTFWGFGERHRETECRREDVEDLGKMLKAMMDLRRYFKYDGKCLGGGHLATCCVLQRILRKNFRELCTERPTQSGPTGEKKAKVCKSGDRMYYEKAPEPREFDCLFVWLSCQSEKVGPPRRKIQDGG